MRPVTVLLGLLFVPLAAAAPEQVHLGLPTMDPSTALGVVWVDTELSDEARVVVEGPEGEREVAARRVDGPGVGFTYEATVDGLAPDTTYAYRVMDRAFELTTAAGPNATVTFVALGDMAVTEASAATVAAIEDLAPDFVLHAGDISYAEGDPVVWKEWFDLVEPVAAHTPWITALGNHETYTGTSAVALVPGFPPSPVELQYYRQRFQLPGEELWYSFDWGPVHVVALDTFSESSIPATQLAWLERDLLDHANAPWTVVLLHEPPYSSNANHGSSPRVQDAFVPLFEAVGVDLVIAAHDHSYERTKPMLGGEVVDRGVVYVVTGGGGNTLYTEWEEPAPEWSAARDAIYHVVAFEASSTRLAGRVVPTMGDDFADAFELTREDDEGGDVFGAVEDRPATPGLAPALVALVLALTGVALRRMRT